MVLVSGGGGCDDCGGRRGNGVGAGDGEGGGQKDNVGGGGGGAVDALLVPLVPFLARLAERFAAGGVDG